jgi:hypothetical protein
MKFAVIIGVVMLDIIGFFGYLAYCDFKMQKADKQQVKEDAKLKK